MSGCYEVKPYGADEVTKPYGAAEVIKPHGEEEVTKPPGVREASHPSWSGLGLAVFTQQLASGKTGGAGW